MGKREMNGNIFGTPMSLQVRKHMIACKVVSLLVVTKAQNNSGGPIGAESS